MRGPGGAYPRIVTLAFLLAFLVSTLGAYVRLSDAGLSCPDWPGCYGQLGVPGASEVSAAQALYPDRPLDRVRAWKEMAHRYAAGLLGLLVVLITVLAWRRSRPGRMPVLPCFLLGLVVFQALLGMWTVTLGLAPLIVTAHLLAGLATVALLWWLRLRETRHGHIESPRSHGTSHDSLSFVDSRLRGNDEEHIGRFVPSFPRHVPSFPRKVESTTRVCVRAGADPLSVEGSSGGGASGLRAWALGGVLVVALQIALGGWTSANYAALACPDFPLCQARLLPPLDLRGAFSLWPDAAGGSFEGGVHDNDARVTIHVVHRLGAVLTLLYVIAFTARVFASDAAPRLGAAAAVLLAVALGQAGLGIVNVLLGLPIALAVGHNAGAILLLLAMVSVYHMTRPPPPIGI